jgi:glycosyltransferase involved in cell wall biosynthesis
VIPTWNRARLVCEAVDSALAQGEERVEIIVVDDGSTDGTAELLTARFGTKVHQVRLAGQSGPGAARNAGVRVARGELLAFLDSDDIWLPGKLDAELSIFEQFPDADAIVSDAAYFLEGELDQPNGFEKNGLLAATGGRPRWLADCDWAWTKITHCVATCAMTLRSAALERVEQPLFAEDLGASEDWEMGVRIFQKCRVVVLPDVWSHVRRFDDGLRLGRPCPGKPWTREQDIAVQRDHIKVLERVSRAGLTPELIAALDRDLAGCTEELAQLLTQSLSHSE